MPAPAAELSEEKLLSLALAMDERDTDEQSVAALTESGDERVKKIFERMMERALVLWEGNLYGTTAGLTDKQLPLVRAWDDQPITDAQGQAIVVPRSETKMISGTRKARRGLQDALSVIDLMSREAGLREAAALQCGDVGQVAALPKLRELAEDDPVASVRRVARESAALIVLRQLGDEATRDERVAAAAALGEVRSLRGLSVLEDQRDELIEQKSTDAEALKVYNASIQKIERHRWIVRWAGHVFKGISAGSILILLALGLAVAFGLMGVINMAHGEMLMIGAVTTWAIHEVFVAHVPEAWFNWYFILAFPLSFAVAAVAGLITEALVVRFLYKRPLDSLLATIGVFLIIIQAVRLWKGDNLGMSSPAWLTGGAEVIQDLVLPYNRLFIIGLTAGCLAFVTIIFRFTRLGLMIRATAQNREMAKSLGVNTRMVDMCTFALGAGLAGIAGFAITLVSNVTPEMGQGYIVKSFLVVVFGGVGNLLGVIVAGLSLGFLEKMIEPFFDATWAQVIVLAVVVLFIQRKPAGLFPDRGRLADQADGEDAPWLVGKRSSRRTEIIGGLILAGIGLLFVPMLYATGMMSIEMVNKLGQFVAFAIVAVGLDLIWGYMGVLSLCQFLFFTLGGYAMGLYLCHHGPLDGVNEVPRALYVVSSAVGDIQTPWFWMPFKSLPIAILLGLLAAGLVALAIGMSGFISRVRGVYFAILTQAITVAFWLVFQKNDIQLCGTNGLTNFVSIAGFDLASAQDAPWYAQTRFWLYIISVLSLLGCFAIAKWLTRSGFGRILVAIRDDEPRLRFQGYRTWAFKVTAFVVAALFAAVGGMLYTPQKGIITPEQMTAFSSILVVVWVALGGRGTLWGAVLGAMVVNLLYDVLTSRAPSLWPFALGGLFIAVVLLLPGGLMSLPGVLGRRIGKFRGPSAKVGAKPGAKPVIEGDAA